MVELCLRMQDDRAFAGEILLGECPRPAAAPPQRGLDLGLDRKEAAVGVAQEDQPHGGQEVLVLAKLELARRLSALDQSRCWMSPICSKRNKLATKRPASFCVR